MSTTTFTEQLRHAHQCNQSMLCVGLDPDVRLFPHVYKNDASKIYDFCVQIVEATQDCAIAFKPQIAYFSAVGAEAQLEKIIRFIRDNVPHIPVILDAKRGDIGATAVQYAREAFERYGADAVTLSPFMGFDTIEPYLTYHNKGAYLLCRTSNAGGKDIQNQVLKDVKGNPKVYEYIAEKAASAWNSNGQLGLVVGATYPEEIARVQNLAPTLPLLIPGIGAQGGDIAATVKAACHPENKGLVAVNSSRAILYASSESDFAQAARAVALTTRQALQDAL